MTGGRPHGKRNRFVVWSCPGHSHSGLSNISDKAGQVRPQLSVWSSGSLSEPMVVPASPKTDAQCSDDYGSGQGSFVYSCTHCQSSDMVELLLPTSKGGPESPTTGAGGELVACEAMPDPIPIMATITIEMIILLANFAPINYDTPRHHISNVLVRRVPWRLDEQLSAFRKHRQITEK